LSDRIGELYLAASTSPFVVKVFEDTVVQHVATDYRKVTGSVLQCWLFYESIYRPNAVANLGTADDSLGGDDLIRGFRCSDNRSPVVPVYLQELLRGRRVVDNYVVGEDGQESFSVAKIPGL